MNNSASYDATEVPPVAFKNRFFPHLLPVDIAVWERFLALHGKAYSKFDYDVRVGVGRDPGDIVPETIRIMAVKLSQRRIDAVGWTPNRLDIIEITTDAGLTAIGQLEAYPRLYKAKFQPTTSLRPVLVCESIQTDLQTTLDELDVVVYIV